MSRNTSCLLQPWFALCQTRKTSPAHKQLFTEARNRYNGMVESGESDYNKIEQAGTIQLFLKNCWELVRFKISSFVDFSFGLATYDSLDFSVENFDDYYIQYMTKDIESYCFHELERTSGGFTTPATNESIRCPHLFLGFMNTCCTMTQQIIKTLSTYFQQILFTWSNANSSSKSLG